MAQNKINKKVYIGLTTRTLRERKSGHKSNAKRGCTNASLFWKAIRKYGFKNFNWSILATASNLQELGEQEKYFISLYESNNTKKGYNVSPGGVGGSSLWTKKFRKIRSIKYSGAGNPMSGKYGNNNPNFIHLSRSQQDGIVTKYQNGESIDTLSRKFKVNWNKIRTCLKEHNVHLRTRVEVMKLLPQNRKQE